LPALNGPNVERPVLFSTPAEFASSDYSPANLQKLRAQMHSALKEEGLFADEADALLNSWELSYFKSPGLRLFFMVPKLWTDLHLPLEVSVPAEIKRAMVGRLELVTPEHRALLSQLAHAPTPTEPWVHVEVRHGWAALVGTPPPLYQQLGRFRNALLLDEFAARPTRSLAAFINLNQLWGYGRGPVEPGASANSAGLSSGINAPPGEARTSMLSGRLATAATRGDVDMVASLLSEGADPNAGGYLHMTPLAALAFSGRLKDDKPALQIADLLLANGAGIDATDDNGVTALYWATESKKTNLVRFLLEKGASPDVRMGRGSLKGRTPLHEAASRGQLEIVEALVEFKAPLDAVDGEGSTPLALAEGNEHTEVANLLRRALQASGQSVLAERATPPTREAMRAIAQRLANGDEAAYNDLSAAAQALYQGINFQKEAARVRMNLFKMKAAFDLLGEEAGKGNKIAMEALKRSLRDRSNHLASFAPDALGMAAAAGQEEALDILLRYNEWDILESTTVFAMAAPASANRERAVAFMISYLSDPQHHGGGMALSATEALKIAGAKGNQQARDAVTRYERANPAGN
jgi:ankyrin repeat protein